MTLGMWRVVCFAVIVYLTLDFSDPNLPGVLNFDADQSVDAVSTPVRGHVTAAKPPMAPVPGPLASPVVTPDPVIARIHTPPVTTNVVPVDLRARGLLPSFAPAPPDDH